jgi:hypothetical protein
MMSTDNSAMIGVNLSVASKLTAASAIIHLFFEINRLNRNMNALYVSIVAVVPPNP